MVVLKIKLNAKKRYNKLFIKILILFPKFED
jgi:hypothetical protein